MASFFNLELDTTPPLISIIAPKYTVPGVETDILVISNEVLAEYQDVYVIDSSGKKYVLIFDHQGDQLSGKCNFNECSIGIATIYARAKDNVLNLSDIATATIDVRQSAKVFVTITEVRRDIPEQIITMPVVIALIQRDIVVTLATRETSLNEITRGIEVCIT